MYSTGGGQVGHSEGWEVERGGGGWNRDGIGMVSIH